MLGVSNVFRRKMPAKLSGEISSQSGVRSYIRAALTNKGGLVAHVLPDQEHLISYAQASALIVVDEGVTSFREGSDVEVLLLDRGGN
jgi:molybdopterin biosynthesis enzyme